MVHLHVNHVFDSSNDELPECEPDHDHQEERSTYSDLCLLLFISLLTMSRLHIIYIQGHLNVMPASQTHRCSCG